MSTTDTRHDLDGRVLAPGHDALRASTTLWNGAVRACPALVVRPRDETETAPPVPWARPGSPWAVATARCWAPAAWLRTTCSARGSSSPTAR
jgi:hypothetical protein